MRYFFNIPSNNNECNLNCSYCIVKENDKEKKSCRQFSIEQLQKFILDNIDIDKDDVLIGFGGSEPFTNSNLDDTIKMLDFIEKYNFGISLLTNGLLNIDIIKKYSHLLSKERKKNTPGDMEEVSDLIITYHRYDLGDAEEYYDKLIGELKKLNINVVFQEIAIPCLFEKSKKFLKQIETKHNVIVKMIKLRSWGEHTFDKEFISKLYKEFGMGSNTSYTNYSNIVSEYCSCFKGFDTYHILYNGKIIKCWYNQTEVGNIITNKLYKDKAIKLERVIKDNKLIEIKKIVECVDKEKFIEDELMDIYISESI